MKRLILAFLILSVTPAFALSVPASARQTVVSPSKAAASTAAQPPTVNKPKAVKPRVTTTAVKTVVTKKTAKPAVKSTTTPVSTKRGITQKKTTGKPTPPVVAKPAPQAPAPPPLRMFSVNLTGQAGGAYSKAELPGGYGVGFAVFAEFRPVTVISFGVGLGFADFFGGGGMQTSWFDLGGRIYPLKCTDKGEAYLQGGVGFAPLRNSLDGHWWGKYHGTAGTGYRRFLNRSTALDMGVQYDIFSPLSASLNCVSLKFGLSFVFGGPVKNYDD